jgi:hypothetical protein
MAAGSSYIENCDKTNFLHFRTQNSVTLDTNYDILTNPYIDNEFLGIITDSAVQ